MKYVLVIILLFAALSCNKKDGELTTTPEWLLLKIGEIQSSEQCGLYNVEKITHKGSVYFNIYCSFWSCRYCELYDKQGIKPDWDEEEWKEFIESEKESVLFWKCGDEIK